MMSSISNIASQIRNRAQCVAAGVPACPSPAPSTAGRDTCRYAGVMTRHCLDQMNGTKTSQPHLSGWPAEALA